MIRRFDDFELDLERFELRRGTERIHVEPQVFDVLAHLTGHADRVVTKEELLDEVWGTRFVTESTLTSRVKSARRAIGDDGSKQALIRTVRGRGFRFAVPVETVGNAPGSTEPSGHPAPESTRPATVPETEPLIAANARSPRWTGCWSRHASCRSSGQAESARRGWPCTRPDASHGHTDSPRRSSTSPR
jgi:DNA-binding winged helix-turn-helix (wHTH) protein